MVTGATSEEIAEIKELKAEVRRLDEDNEILRRASMFFAGDSTPQSLIVAFFDELRTEGHPVESICRVLREQGCQIAARTYRDWPPGQRPRRGPDGQRRPCHQPGP